MGYHLPSDTDFVSCSWQCHRDRNPPSSEPGTDYGVGYGHILYAADNGTVVDYKTSNSNATGRYLTIDLDDGRRVRYLHLSEIWVTSGRVGKGQQIGKTGASGYGSDWGYGAHVHASLWPGHYYEFCSSCTIDFALYVGSSDPAPTQRVVGANGATNPSTANAVTQTLPPGTLADFNGWIRGENVQGNNVWFRGAHSGDWFWSGGFTDTGTHDLADLNPVAPADPKQRVVGPNGANGRSDPSTNGGVINPLAPNAVANMAGWITGQDVEGNTVWFQEAGGTFYWSGGFTDAGTHDLVDLNQPDPPAPTQRTVGTNPANIRDLPYTTSPAHSSADGGTVVDMDGFTHAQAVEGNDVWFRRKADADWMWSGGFTSAATDGLTAVPTPAPPTPNSPDNPRGLKEYDPIWRFAFQGLEAPLGFKDCANPVDRALRDNAGGDPVDPIIDTYIFHWTGTMVDQMDYFSYCNSRSVAPTMYMRRDGSQSEMIRPGAKPAATGPDWNWRSFAVETLADEGDDFTAEQWEAHAQNIAELARLNGKTLDGVPVEFTIDNEHVLGHREALPGTTECPGDHQIAYKPQLLARAREIFEGEAPPEPPDGGPLDPEEYPTLFDLYEELGQAFGDG
jgi:murein DD-endopeptidase MepM/ murein hydrolase activator NlpD